MFCGKPGTVFILISVIVSTPYAYFGLTTGEPLNFKYLLNRDGFDRKKIDIKEEKKICDILHLKRQQRKMCGRGRGLATSLLQAIRLSFDECSRQFAPERWNCTLARYRKRILRKGFKETSFLYAISSAALVHVLSSACSSGLIDRCTCDESKHLENTQTWMWGGCGHNIRFGIKYSRNFLFRGLASGKDIRAKVDRHNSNVGIRAVMESMKTVCKCHGVSGSCTMKSCWRQLPNFHFIGSVLKSKYQLSKKFIEFTNEAAGNGNILLDKSNVTFSKKISHKRKCLLFIDDSPSFCNPGKYSPGTSGRNCNDCEVMCCGRGYNVKTIKLNRNCHCRVIWCCNVYCQSCTSENTSFVCK